MSLRFAVFASGTGSNLQSLIDRINGLRVEWGRIVLVVSDRPGVRALERARTADIPTSIIPVAGMREADVAGRTIATLESERVDAIALAGYLRLVPPAVIERYQGRVVNIHPALLPAFGGKGMYGLHVHRAVLAAGSRVTGVTVHRVNERYDEGQPLAQWPVPVLPGDTPETLAARVLEVEHRLYPAALELLARRIAGHAAQVPTLFDAFHPAPDAPDVEAVRHALGLDPAN